MHNSESIRKGQSGGRSAGFSLLELLVAMAIFLVIGGALTRLFVTHVPLFTAQQNQAALNFTLRNAAAQMQIDVVNAGNGFYPVADIAAWPVGITIKNNYADNTNCYDATTKTYGPDCFDELNVISVDTTVPLAHPADNGANCVSSTSSNVFATPVTGTLDNLASYFKSGDQVLLITSDLQHYTTTTLTKDAQVTGGKVKLQHNPTGAGGQNTSDDDPFHLTTGNSNQLGENFCDDDWILKLSPSGTVTYRVDTTDPSDPKLIRENKLLNTSDVIAEQIIGFKVGASVAGSDADFRYKADNAETDDPKGYSSNWALIKAVRMTLIGRTPPNAGGSAQFRNSFDQGPYKVESVSVVVNPRNLSMN
jgi:prepilin-type N-terminal cleavage/methylation domain-containing protein